MDLTLPLSADPELLQHVAGLALRGDIYVLVATFGMIATGMCLGVVGRLPSWTAINQTLCLCLLALVATAVVSATTTLPFGIAILLPGAGVAFLLPLAILKSVGEIASQIGSAVSFARAERARRFVPPPITAVFTRRSVRISAVVFGFVLVLLSTVLGMLPIILIGSALALAGMQPRSRYWAFARKSYRTAWAKRRAALAATNHP